MKKTTLTIGLTLVLSTFIFADGGQSTGNKNCPQNSSCFAAEQSQPTAKPLIVKLFEFLGLV